MAKTFKMINYNKSHDIFYFCKINDYPYEQTCV